MRVVFTAEVLADEHLWRELDLILGTVDDGWHHWELPDPDAVEKSAWLERGRLGLRSLFETASRTSAWLGRGGPHGRRVLVVRETEETSRMTLIRAVGQSGTTSKNNLSSTCGTTAVPGPGTSRSGNCWTPSNSWMSANV